MDAMHTSIRLLLLGLGMVAAGAVWAADEGGRVASLVRESLPGAGTNDAPRVIRYDTPAEPQRAMPGYRAETTEVGYRWWMSRGRADLGLGLGTLTQGARPTGSLPGLANDGSASVQAAAAVMTVGMRYRSSDRSTFYADASGVRGRGFDGGEAVVGKVGVEFKAAQSRFDIAYGGLGLKLDGDTRMTVRLKRGGLGIFMRSKF
jgi:hypothetical protein